VVVVQIDRQPAEVVAQVVDLAEQSAGRLVGQPWPGVALYVKEAPFQDGYFSCREGSLGERQPPGNTEALQLGFD
jgi:hypothetical protein